MNWLWAFLRRKTADSILAGIHDALTAGGTPSGLSEEQAARATRALLGVPDIPPSGTHNGAPPTPPQRPGPLTPDTNQNAPVTPGEPPRRGPGRPRKYQEPPQ